MREAVNLWNFAKRKAVLVSEINALWFKQYFISIQEYEQHIYIYTYRVNKDLNESLWLI